MRTAEEWFAIMSPHLAEQRKKYGPLFHQKDIDLIQQIMDENFNGGWRIGYEKKEQEIQDDAITKP